MKQVFSKFNLKDIQENAVSRSTIKYRRRRYLIDPGFQYWFIGKITILAVSIIVFSLFLLALAYQQYADITVELMQPDPFGASGGIRTVSKHGSAFSLLWPVLAISLTGTLLVTLFFGLIISHRMAGPVYRIRMVLKEMSEGNLSGKLVLRKNDAFHPLAGSINILGDSWRKNVQELQELCGKLESAVDGNGQEQLLKRINELLAGFKTK